MAKPSFRIVDSLMEEAVFPALSATRQMSVTGTPSAEASTGFPDIFNTIRIELE
jgi:hypothetical protein